MDKYLGIYVHLPFCASKCAYCDFYSLADCEDMMPQYQEALLQHIKEASPQLNGYYTDTIYFGGGTPSFYGAKKLVALFNAFKKYGKVLKDAEVTLEANPDSITYLDMLLLRKAGFNRISFGVQSTDDGLLKSLGRRHNFAQVVDAVANARKAGFENVSLDLIYGLPSQTRESWADTLNKAITLKPEHFSCYGLKIEKGTPLYTFRDSPFIPDDDAQADMYLYTVETLERFGYHQYEISNFAQRGYVSQHNLKYWSGKEYMGFGAAAHSYVGGFRYSYVSDASKYSANIMSGTSVVDHRELISGFEQAGEYLMLGLRTTLGITKQEYLDIFPCNFDVIEEVLVKYAKLGLATCKDGRWRLTPEGFLLSNTIIAEVLTIHTRQHIFEGAAWKISETPTEDQLTLFTKHPEDIQPFKGVS